MDVGGLDVAVDVVLDDSGLIMATSCGLEAREVLVRWRCSKHLFSQQGWTVFAKMWLLLSRGLLHWLPPFPFFHTLP